MRQIVGTFILGAVAILASMLTSALHWPWPWWVLGLIGALCLVAGILMTWRDRKRLQEIRSTGDRKSVV